MCYLVFNDNNRIIGAYYSIEHAREALWDEYMEQYGSEDPTEVVQYSRGELEEYDFISDVGKIIEITIED